MDTSRIAHSVSISKIILHVEFILTTDNFRTMNVIALFDCSFCFYSNFPCRMLIAEMTFDLPCEAALFSAPHPFADPRFKPSRNMTVVEAFQSFLAQVRETPTVDSEARSNPSKFTVTDMFIIGYRMPPLFIAPTN